MDKYPQREFESFHASYPNDKKLPNFQACPDFSISKPLPFSLVGEVKYFRSGSSEYAVKELTKSELTTRHAVQQWLNPASSSK